MYTSQNLLKWVENQTGGYCLLVCEYSEERLCFQNARKAVQECLGLHEEMEQLDQGDLEDLWPRECVLLVKDGMASVMKTPYEGVQVSAIGTGIDKDRLCNVRWHFFEPPGLHKRLAPSWLSFQQRSASNRDNPNYEFHKQPCAANSWRSFLSLC